MACQNLKRFVRSSTQKVATLLGLRPSDLEPISREPTPITPLPQPNSRFRNLREEDTARKVHKIDKEATPPQVEKFPRPKEDRTASPRSRYHPESKSTSPSVSVASSREIGVAAQYHPERYHPERYHPESKPSPSVSLDSYRENRVAAQYHPEPYHPERYHPESKSTSPSVSVASSRENRVAAQYSQEVEYSNAPIVIDCGSGYIKAGFASEDRPTTVFPTIVGRPRKGIVVGAAGRSSYVGEGAQSMRGVLSFKYPIDRGVVTDWDDMEKIWQHCFANELCVDPQLHPVLLTEIPNNPRANRERMTQIMFELFNVPAMYVTVQAILSLLSTGNLTGLAVDSGEGITNIVPIYEGYPLTYAINKLNLAGKDLNEYLMRLINQRGYSLSTTTEKELVRDMKETMCYVSQDFERELITAETRLSLESQFKLPDGNFIHIANERFICPEALFDPMVLGHKTGGLHFNINKSILKCDRDLQRNLYKKIVLAGGNTLFPGIEARLKTELSRLAPDYTVQILAERDRQYSVWKGGAALASLSTFENMYITNQEYYEVGPNIVNIKCF
uniref:Actin n=1 Tax=Glossina austeni TaxID=7395 RepID=A0A1A9VRY3_GLOAU